MVVQHTPLTARSSHWENTTVQVGTTILNINSEQPQRLQKFYSEVVGLPAQEGMGEGALNAGGAILVFDGHSEVHGDAADPQRHLLNFMIDDLADEQARLESQGVKFIRTAGKEYWGGVISTFLDPDGNYCQLIEYKP